MSPRTQYTVNSMATSPTRALPGPKADRAVVWKCRRCRCVLAVALFPAEDRYVRVQFHICLACKERIKAMRISPWGWSKCYICNAVVPTASLGRKRKGGKRVCSPCAIEIDFEAKPKGVCYRCRGPVDPTPSSRKRGKAGYCLPCRRILRHTKPQFYSRWAAQRGQRIRATDDGTLTDQVLGKLFSAANCCPYCQTKLAELDKSLDHFLPLCLGGQHSVFNAVVCCRPCNLKKNQIHPKLWLSLVVYRRVLWELISRRKVFGVIAS